MTTAREQAEAALREAERPKRAIPSGPGVRLNAEGYPV